MKNRVAAIVSWEDLKTYFKPPIWVDTNFSDDKFEGRSKYYSVTLEPESVLFDYEIFAVDDELDKEQGISDDPVSEIVKFLGQGLPGSEFFEQRASGPEYVSDVLRKLSISLVRERRSSIQVAQTLRKISIMPRIASLETQLRSSVLRLAMSADKAFDDLEKKMESKGWDISKGEAPNGLPEIKVNISDIYNAKISVDSISYSYIFQFKDRNDLTKEGTTTDPIEEFQKFYRSEEIEDAKQGDKEKEFVESETVPSQRNPKSEEQDMATMPAKKPA